MSDLPTSQHAQLTVNSRESCSTVSQASKKDGSTKGQSVSPSSLNNAEAGQVKTRSPAPPAYCALIPGRRRLILGIVTVAGMLGPLSGAIYLPILPLLEREFNVGSTSINATVSMFMVTFAIAVSSLRKILVPVSCHLSQTISRSIRDLTVY